MQKLSAALKKQKPSILQLFLLLLFNLLLLLRPRLLLLFKAPFPFCTVRTHWNIFVLHNTVHTKETWVFLAHKSRKRDLVNMTVMTLRTPLRTRLHFAQIYLKNINKWCTN